ncbi:MAG TPA: TetR/AcrR family transcriptional regulator [Anaeromyxobacteraceae bacterium]
MTQPTETMEHPAPVKRRQILAGAREAFCELGYERASVELVAARAGVAKATVYSHFHDKKALFVACFSEHADEMREGLRAAFSEPAGELEPALQQAGEKLLAVLLSPAIVALYRHTTAEAVRFPEVGQAVFERGPAVVYDLVADYLRRWHEQGALRVDDPRAAAVQFVMLCQADLALRVHLGLPRPAEGELRDAVRRAVRTFLRAFAA